MRKLPNARWMKIHTICSIGIGKGVFGDGLAAVVDGEEAGLIGYAMDSFTDFYIAADLNWDDEDTEVSYNWLWEGTTAELFHAARTCTDLMFPTRKLSPEDSDYADMMKIYTAIRTCLRKKNKKKKRNPKLNTTDGFSSVLDNKESENGEAENA